MSTQELIRIPEPGETNGASVAQALRIARQILGRPAPDAARWEALAGMTALLLGEITDAIRGQRTPAGRAVREAVRVLHFLLRAGSGRAQAQEMAGALPLRAADFRLPNRGPLVLRAETDQMLVWCIARAELWATEQAVVE